MQVLYLTYDGLLDPLGQSQILPYVKKLRERLGISFRLLSFEKAHRWREQGQVFKASLEREGMHWTPLSFTQSPPLLAKAYDAFRMKQTAERLLRTERHRLLHARSYVAGWTAHRLSLQYRVPWIFDMRGFWADEKRETGAWPAHNPFFDQLYKVWKKRERRMLQSATHVVVLTEAAREVLLTWGLPADKISVIPCVADYDHFFMPPEERVQVRKEIRKQLNIPENAYVLGYVGSIGPLYAVEEMFRFFRLLQARLPESYFVFFTPASPDILRERAEANRVSPSQIRTIRLPHAKVPTYLPIFDSSIIFCRPGFSRIGSSPTRIAELLAMDIPVIAQAELGDNQTLSKQISGLLLCEDLSEAAYQKALDLLLTQRGGSSHSPRDTSQALLSLERGINEYEAIYRRFQEASPAARRSLTK